MLYPLSFPSFRVKLEQHDDVDYESFGWRSNWEVFDDSLEGSAYPTGANDSQPYQSLDEGKSINIRSILALTIDFVLKRTV